MRSWISCLASLVALSLISGCQKLPSADDSFDNRVHAYLLTHPEVLLEVEQRLQTKAADLAATAATTAVAEALKTHPALRAALEHDPADFVANPAGTVTVTEFYDYRCPHCINAAPWVMKLVRNNSDIRFVFKETPIFGPLSEHAAVAALAVKRAGGDSLGYYATLMASRAIDDALIDRTARAKGAREVDLAQPPQADLKHLADTGALMDQLNLNGTPVFIVGNAVVAGDRVDQVQIAINKARGPSGA